MADQYESAPHEPRATSHQCHSDVERAEKFSSGDSQFFMMTRKRDCFHESYDGRIMIIVE